ncbi:MAG: hypothetical protein R3D25_15960 [Geminicoccaceae bacterium]
MIRRPRACSTRTVRGLALRALHGLALGMQPRHWDADPGAGRPRRARLMLDMFGEVIDGKPPLEGVERRSIHARPVPLRQRVVRSEIFETGIKAIDLPRPLERGGKAAFGGVKVGATVLITEMIHNMVGKYEVSLFCGIGERCREAEDLYREMQTAGVLGTRR